MRHSRLYGAIALLALNSALSGCTLTGYVLGSMIDGTSKRNFGPAAFAPDSARQGTLKSGTKLKLYLKDGEVVEGTYLEVTRLPAAEYARPFANARERYDLEPDLPEPGDTVTLTLTGGEALRGELLGFDGCRWIVVKRETERRVAASDVLEMSDGRGRTVSGRRLDRMLSSGALPSISALAFAALVRHGRSKREESRLIPLDSISYATSESKTFRTTFMLVGLAVDVAGAVSAIALADEGFFGGGW